MEEITKLIKDIKDGEQKMGKKKRYKPTNKDFEMAIIDVMKKINYIDNKFTAFDNLFGLYLQWKKEDKEFKRFISLKAKEHQGSMDTNEN